jgi:hypothetical protein
LENKIIHKVLGVFIISTPHQPSEQQQICLSTSINHQYSADNAQSHSQIDQDQIVMPITLKEVILPINQDLNLDAF